MIGIVGGTGDFGQGLAERLRRIGEEVELGSRTPHGEFVANRQCAQDSDLVFLSVPPTGVVDMCMHLSEALDGKIVVSVASPVVFENGRPIATPAEHSLAELAAHAAPGARVVAGFHTVSARALADPDDALEEDVILCGDDEDAKGVVGSLAERIVSGRAVDAGRLEVARWLEPVTVVLLNVNRRYKVSSGVRVTGLP